MERLTKEFKQREIEVIGISGGDGTYQKTLTTIVNVYKDAPLPKIAFLRGGTMNNVADCLKIRGTPETILSRLIYRYHQDVEFQIVNLPLLKVNNIYGFLFGNGLLYRFLVDFNKVLEPTKLRAAWMLFFAMCHAYCNSKRGAELCQRVDADVLIDGKPWPFKNYVTIYAGTVETLGLGFFALYRTRTEPGKFQINAFSMPPRQVVNTFPRILMGKKVGSEHYLDAIATEVKILTKEPQGFMLDGELYPAVSEIKLSLGPTLQIITG